MRILGIESSCDECSFAIVENGTQIRSLITYSQLKEHNQFGGVVPELASRLHIKYISQLYRSMLEELAIPIENMREYIDGIAVTTSPGLSGSLMVGVNFAKGLALAIKKPLIGIDHIQAHFYSGLLEKYIEYPYIGVVVSGGHSLIAVVHNYNDIEIMGYSIDDACGETFDKVARELNLGYPGGQIIDELAKKGDINAASFPIYQGGGKGKESKTDKKNLQLNFSYSGLKTAVIHHRDKYWNPDYSPSIENIAATFQNAAISMITTRIKKLIEITSISRVSLGGGVACNSLLQLKLQQLQLTLKKEQNLNVEIVIPSKNLCMDNAAMIAGLGYCYFKDGANNEKNIKVLARNTKYKL